MTDADIKRIESKLDLIIDSFGLSENHRLAPVEIDQLTKNIVLKFENKRRNKNGHGSQKD
jgi:hypothetical protein